MLIVIDAPAPPPKPLVVPCGPPAPTLKGAHSTSTSASFSIARASRSALREMPGAIVVVEEDAAAPISREAYTRSLGRSKLRLLTKKDLPVFPSTPPMPRWMDPNVTMSGGNTVAQVFPIGYGY